MSRACHELLSRAKNRKQKAELLKNQKETTLNHAGLQRACGHAEAGLARLMQRFDEFAHGWAGFG